VCTRCSRTGKQGGSCDPFQRVRFQHVYNQFSFSGPQEQRGRPKLGLPQCLQQVWRYITIIMPVLLLRLCQICRMTGFYDRMAAILTHHPLQWSVEVDSSLLLILLSAYLICRIKFQKESKNKAKPEQYDIFEHEYVFPFSYSFSVLFCFVCCCFLSH